MCGITGQARWDGRPVSRELVGAMCGAIEHRGPDKRGMHVAGPVGLGIQRLRVVDLETGDQPMTNEDGSVVVVLNGEIYNYRELREGLLQRGHTLRSQGDTEVIAHLYEEHGPACVTFLAGMFAFALWDERRGRLVLGRDRLGKKPLLYALRDGALTFGSELGAVMRDPEIDRGLDLQALDGYFTFSYVPEPRSAFAAVRKLPPAHTLVLEDGRATIAEYWAIDPEARVDVRDEREAGELVRDALDGAVRRRLHADVPVGAFLSGGVDSTAVVGAMAEAASGPVRTFSIGFQQEEFNELPQARAVAELFGTEHHEFVVEADTIGLLPDLARRFGEPFADHAALPTFLLAQLAREHVTVALNGDGGDEIFGGYDRYVNASRLGPVASLPAPARRALAAALRRAPAAGHRHAPAARARRMGDLLALGPAEAHLVRMSRHSWPRRASAYTPEFLAALDSRETAGVITDTWESSGAPTAVERMMDVDRRTYLPGDLLVKADMMTMAVGLEGRSPLLDHELVELAYALPAAMKVDGSRKKIALRAALRGRVPDALIDRRKQGFELPLGAWFRGELAPLARETLLAPDAAVAGFFRPSHVRELVEDHTAGARDNGSMLWTLLVFELWHRQVVSGEIVEGSHVLAA